MKLKKLVKRKDTDLIINEIILEEFKINLKNIINITNDNNFKISSNITAKILIYVQVLDGIK